MASGYVFSAVPRAGGKAVEGAFDWPHENNPLSGHELELSVKCAVLERVKNSEVQKGRRFDVKVREVPQSDFEYSFTFKAGELD